MLTLVLYALCSCTPQQEYFHHPCINIDELFKTPTSTMQSKNDQVVLVQEDGSTARFRTTGARLFVNRCLIGRGSHVFLYKITDAEKLLWPDDWCIREADMIYKLRDAVPEMVQHLPDMTCSADIVSFAKAPVR